MTLARFAFTIFYFKAIFNFLFDTLFLLFVKNKSVFTQLAVVSWFFTILTIFNTFLALLFNKTIALVTQGTSNFRVLVKFLKVLTYQAVINCTFFAFNKKLVINKTVSFNWYIIKFFIALNTLVIWTKKTTFLRTFFYLSWFNFVVKVKIFLKFFTLRKLWSLTQLTIFITRLANSTLIFIKPKITVCTFYIITCTSITYRAILRTIFTFNFFIFFEKQNLIFFAILFCQFQKHYQEKC